MKGNSKIILLIFIILLFSISTTYASNETDINNMENTDNNELITNNQNSNNIEINENNTEINLNNTNNTYSIEKNNNIPYIGATIYENPISEKSSKLNTYFSINSVDICSGKAFHVILKTYGNNNNGIPLSNKTIWFNINNRNYNRTTNSEGMASMDINLQPNTYLIKYSFNGDSSFNSRTEENDITVYPNSNTFLLECSGTVIYRTEYFKVALFDYNENRLNGKTVCISINNVPYYRTTDSNGICKLQINLDEGWYLISYSFAGSGNYQTSNGNKYIYVSLMDVELVPIDLNVKNYGGILKIRMTDKFLVPIANQKITIEINGATYNRTTNSTGYANMNINAINSGTYSNCKVSYTAPNNSKYNSKNTITFKLNIYSTNNNNYILTPQNKFISYGSTYDIKLTNYNNVPLSNKKITFMVNNNQYYRTTNSNGLAKMDIYLTDKPYCVSASFGDSSSSCGIYDIIVVTPNTMNAQFIQTTYTEQDYKTYNTSYQCLNSNYLINLANTLTTTCTNNLEKVIAIHSYIFRFNPPYYGNGVKNALDCALLFKGNCYDQSNTLLSLLKILNIPVRAACGYNNTAHIGHAWTQFLIDDNWIVSDPTNTIYIGEWNNNYGNEQFSDDRAYYLALNKDYPYSGKHTV